MAKTRKERKALLPLDVIRKREPFIDRCRMYVLLYPILY